MRSYCAMMRQYLTVGRAALQAFAAGAQPWLTRDLFDAATEADQSFWSLNRAAAGGLDQTLARVDAEIAQQLRRQWGDAFAAYYIPRILAVLPEPLETLEESYWRMACDDPATRWATPNEKTFVWAAMIGRGLSPTQHAALPNASHARSARAEAEEAVGVAGSPRLGKLLDAHDALVYLNVFVEAQWGFKGWPGLAIAATRLLAERSS